MTTVSEGWSADYRPGTTYENIKRADEVSVTYDASTGVYSVKVPGFAPGMLTQYGEGRVIDGVETQRLTFYGATLSSQGGPSGAKYLEVLKPGSPNNPYRYVGYANWYADEDGPGSLVHASMGDIGVAIPTIAGDVPRSGSATYFGDVFGNLAGNGGDTLRGKARLSFDFERATLGGQLQLELVCMWGCGRVSSTFELTDTSFVRGDTQFTGKISGEGQFSGIFAGPGAAELLARFQFPYQRPDYREKITASGVILGKRD